MKYINPYQISYYNILTELVTDPDKRTKSRVGDTRSKFSEKIKVDLKREFPLMEIKQVSFKNIAVELLWFIKGDTNVKFLVDHKCNIWNDDAFRWYNEKYVKLGAPTVTKEEFVEKIKAGEKIYLNETIDDGKICFSEAEHNAHPLWFRQGTKIYTYGDLDIVYGRQWRSFAGKVDQLKDVIEALKKNPDDRRMIILGHNPADIKDGNVALPACHNYMQFYTQPIPLNKRVEIALEQNLLEGDLKALADQFIFYKFGKRKIDITTEVLQDIERQIDELGVKKRYISTELVIRSNDFFLGNPYNVASYALLTHMIAQCVDMLPNILAVEMVDCHLYELHVDAASEWIQRFENQLNVTNTQEPQQVTKQFYCKSKVSVCPAIKDIDAFTLDDLRIENYSHQGKIEAPLLT